MKITLALLVALSLPGLAAEEAVETFVRPRVAVPLLYASAVKPVLGVLVGSSLYYADAFAKGTCLGRDIYKMDLGDPNREEKKLFSVSCIESLQHDGKHVFVVAKNAASDTNRSLYQIEGADLKPALSTISKWGSALAWRRHQLQQATGQPWFDEDPQLALFGVSPASIFSIAYSGPGKKEDLLVLRNSQVRPVHLGVELTDSVPSTIGTDAQGTLFIAVRSKDEESTALLVVPATGKAYWAGGQTNWTDAEPWQTLAGTGQSGWRMRTATPYGAKAGAILHDRTEYQNEWNSLAFYSTESKVFHRFQIPQEFVDGIEGVSLHGEGVLLSNPAQGQIVWFGQKSSFNPKQYPPRDIHLVPIEAADQEDFVVKEQKK